MYLPGESPRREIFRCPIEDMDREKLGTYHMNPLVDTREYGLEYGDGNHDSYFANFIAKNLYS